MARVLQAKLRKVVGQEQPKTTIRIKKPYRAAYLPTESKDNRRLVESERKYRELVELAHEGIVTVDAEENFTFVNQQFAKSLGYKRGELLGKSLFSFATKESVIRLKQGTEIRKKNRKSRYEVVLIHKDGSEKYFWLSISPIFGKGKEFLGSMGVYSDMTERKMIELNLERRVKQINALYRVYSHARIVRRFSSVLNGITEEIVSAFPYNEYVQSHILFDGKSYSYPKKLKRFIHKIELPLIVAGIKRGILTVGYTKRIPDLKRFAFLKEERELTENVAKILCKHMFTREIAGRHKQILTKAFTAQVIVHKGKIKYTNTRFLSMFKCKKADALGKLIIKFLPDYFTSRKNVDGRIKECFGKRFKGDNLELELTLLHITYNGHPSILLRIHDITALKQAQSKLKDFNKDLKTQVKEKTRHLEQANKRLQSLNDLKDEFIAVTSHELRSPLTSIRGYLSFLVEEESLEKMEDPYRAYLMRAYSTTDSLNYLINNILDVSRLDTGRFELQIQQTDIVRLTSGILDGLAFQVGENKLTLKFKNNTNTSTLMVPIDAIRISQVLRNILDNSIKFTKRGKKITVEMLKLGKSVRINVTDQGVGIPKAKLNQVFGKFMQVKNIHTKYKGGVGLGLFISKRIVELHGGKIKADRNEHGGTTISIDLPLTSEAHGKK